MELLVLPTSFKKATEAPCLEKYGSQGGGITRKATDLQWERAAILQLYDATTHYISGYDDPAAA